MIHRGRYVARVADTPEDIRAAQALRSLAFHGQGHGADDADAFEHRFSHMLVEEQATGHLVCCYRFLLLRSGAEIDNSYAAQSYDLAALSLRKEPMVELGRFCTRPGHHHPDMLRLAWAALTAFVDAQGAEMLFGCASFAGTDPEHHRDSLALLGRAHLAPDAWRPGVKAAEVTPLTPLDGRAFDEMRGMQRMPALLRSYLQMGGRVSDHAVIDRDMNTCHVFVGVETRSIPPARKRLLRALAG